MLGGRKARPVIFVNENLTFPAFALSFHATPELHSRQLDRERLNDPPRIAITRNDAEICGICSQRSRISNEMEEINRKIFAFPSYDVTRYACHVRGFPILEKQENSVFMTKH